MFRRLAALALIFLTAILAVTLWATMAPLALNIGSGAIAPIQNVGAAFTIGSGITQGTLSLAAPSTAGTCLLILIGSGQGSTPSVVVPAGFVQIGSIRNGATVDLEVWAYLNNPGRLQAFTFTSLSPALSWQANVSEWSNVASASAVDTSGTATSTTGTTLTVTTAANVANAGGLAIAAWIQTIALNTVTYTTPGGWTRLKDSGAFLDTAHFDSEYQLAPASGAPLSAILTSTGTTTSAAGIMIVLKKAPPVVDQTAFILYGSLAVKLNTLDCQLIDPATVPSLGDPVALTTPTWSGRIVSLTKADIVDIASNHKLITIAATNSTVAGLGQGPGDFGDTAVGGYILAENGFKILQEDGTGALLQEGTRFPYRSLSVQTNQNQDGTVTTYGTLETFQAGYAAGQTFKLYSANLAYTGQSFTITNVSQSWIGAALTGQPTQGFLIEFGDAYQTFQLAGGGVLTQVGSTAVIQPGASIPAGVLGFAEVSAIQGTFTALTDLTGLAATVTTVGGRRIRVSCEVPLSSSVAADILSIGILEGATVLAGGQKAAPSAGGFITLEAFRVLTPTAGVHTYKLSAERASGTGVVTMQAGAVQVGITYYAHILVEDIGT